MRVSIDTIGRLTQLDYEPFGALASMTQLGADLPRQTFIDKEKDAENGLGDFGVRKYEAETGRFLSVDRFWEKYLSYTPYQYSLNIPTILVDPSGLIVEFRGSDDYEKGASKSGYDAHMADLKENNADAYDAIKAIEDDPSVVVGFRLRRPTEHGGSAYDFDAKEVVLESGIGLRYKDGHGREQTLSPTAVFAHEFAGHAFVDVLGATSADPEVRRAAAAPPRSRDREAHAIAVEHKTAKQLGDVNGGPRLNHEDGERIVWKVSMRVSP